MSILLSIKTFFNKTPQRTLVYSLIIISVFLIYLPGISSKMFGDDFERAYVNPAQKIFYYYVNCDPNFSWYRPLPCSIFAISQTLWGLSTIPTHIIQILTHIFLCIVIYEVLKHLKTDILSVSVALAFAVCSQVNVSAINGNDTLTQVFSATFGFSAAAFLFFFFEKGKRIKYFIFSLLFFTIALFSKENGVMYIVFIFSILLYYYKKLSVISLKQVFLYISPFALLAAIYLVARTLVSTVRPVMGDGNYQFGLGFNVIKNFAMLSFALADPISTVTTFIAIQKKDVVSLSLIGILVLLFITVILTGLSKYKRFIFLPLIGAVIFSFFPMILLSKASELHTYCAIPFFAAIVGLSFSAVYKLINRSAVKTILAAFFVILLCLNVYAAETKIEAMKQNGEKCDVIVKQILNKANLVPRNGNIYLVNRKSDLVEYSIFTMNDFNVLFLGENIITQSSNRFDINIKIIPEEKLNETNFGKTDLVLFLKGNEVKTANEL